MEKKEAHAAVLVAHNNDDKRSLNLESACVATFNHSSLDVV